MRVLVLGKRGGILHWPEHIALACQRLNLDCRFLALNHQNSSDRIIRSLKGAVSKHWKQSHLAQALEKQLRQFQPHLLIFPDIITLPEPVKAILRQYKTSFKAVYWIGDFFPDSIRDCNDFIDAFYFTDSFLQQQGEQKGLNRAAWLPLAVDVARFHKQSRPWPERNDELLFVGAWSENRYEILRKIEHPVQIYGKGWDKPFPSHHKVHPKTISLDAVASLYGSHRYVLNIINSNNIKHGLNMRCFEAVSAGAWLVTDHVEDFSRCFEERDPASTYRDIEGLNRLLTELKQRRDQRPPGQDIERLMRHDYQDRVLRIIKGLEIEPNL